MGKVSEDCNSENAQRPKHDVFLFYKVGRWGGIGHFSRADTCLELVGSKLKERSQDSGSAERHS